LSRSKDLAELYQLHEDLISFGSDVQTISNRLFEERKHISPLFFDLGMKIGFYVITLHRAALALCESGWTHITPLLLRAMMESSVNYLTVINNDKPEYMAFKYFSYDYFVPLLSPDAQESTKTKALSEIRHCISLISWSEERQEAERFVNILRARGKPFTFWFQPGRNLNGIGDCIEAVADEDMKKELRFFYKALSATVHGTHMGMVMYKDDPNDLNISPSENPQRTIGMLLISCKLLLEFLRCRCDFEGLELEPRYSELYDSGEKIYRIFRATINS
jgi:hypothetical protein